MEGHAERLRASRRRAWRGGPRAHLQLRRLSRAERAELAEAVRVRLEGVPGVRWARLNAPLNRVVVDHDHELCPLRRLEELLLEIERDRGLAERPFLDEAFAPGDEEPLRRACIAIGAELASVGLSALLERWKARRLPFDVDLAAVLAILEGIPELRALLDRGLTRRGADLLIELGKASLHTILRSEVGPLAAVLRLGLALREARARSLAWERIEGVLCGDAANHPEEHPELPPRPCPLRAGTVERYEESAVAASLSAFAAEVALTFDRQAAASALFGGLPRVARLGRWAFTSQLVGELSARDVVVLDRSALQRLDRIDYVVLHEALAREEHPGLERLVSAARRARRAIRVVGATPQGVRWARGAERLPSSRSLVEVVRELQQGGSGVLLVQRGPDDALAAADLSLALSAEGPPWGAHLIASRGWDDAALIVEALAAARAATKQSVRLALGEAATSLSLLFGGLDHVTTRRIMVSSNIAQMFAIGNAIRWGRSVRRAPLDVPEKEIPWHALTPEDTLARLDGSEQGLDQAQVEGRRRALPKPVSPRRLLARKIGQELANPMTPILSAGAALSAMVGSVADAALIGGALGLNAGIGGVQGYRTERAVLALERREERPVRVVRDGQERLVADDQLVRGDVVLLEAGDVVPADCRILSATSLEVDESSLTGESQPVRKQVEPTPRAHLAERGCMLYEGSSINVGSARAVVVATGEHTEAGRARIEGQQGERPAGVEARLQYLSGLTTPVAGLSALAMTASGLGRNRPVDEVVTSAVGLGVASVPEGLPILATLAQLAAAERLSTRGALVRNPRALEALGRMDVLCADKTGTLTEGQIRLRIVSNGVEERPLGDLDEEHREVLRIALQASPVPNGAPLPHPTDQALLEGARAHGVTRDADNERRAELPFDPARGLHASVEGNGAGFRLGVKGAPEVILPKATRVRRGQEIRDLDEAERQRWFDRADRLAAKGYRVLAVAARGVPGDFEPNDENVSELVLQGFLGYADPVRESAREAIERLDRAGVRVVMITGDHPGTAESIARELGLLNGHRVVTGAELDELDDAELTEAVEHIAVFARVAPLQKVRIVRTLQSAGSAVGMTGDGANDAPAIQLADVGIALGEGSTSAARAAADLIVSDGRIETIMRAVLEGRALWTRVRDAVAILVGGNLGEIAFTVAGGLSGGRSPLNARQLLLVNLLTDTLPALAIAVRPPKNASEEALLSAGPEASLGRELERDMLLRGLVTAAAAATAMTLSRRQGASWNEASTVALLTLTSTQLTQTFVSGGRTAPVIAASAGSLAVLLAAVETPRVSEFFGCRPLGPRGLLQAAAVTAGATAVAGIAGEVLRRERLATIDEARWRRWSALLSRAEEALRTRVPRRLELLRAVAELLRLLRPLESAGAS